MKFKTPDNSNGPFSPGPGISTAMGWRPSYNAAGNLLNHDPNYHSQVYFDSGTGKHYTVIRKDGITRWFKGSISYMDFNCGEHFSEEKPKEKRP